MSAVDKKALRHEMYRKKLPRSYIVVFFVLVFLFTTISYVLLGFYVEHWYTGPARTVARVVPLPAVIVQNDIVWYSEVSEFANVFSLAKDEAEFEIDDPFGSALKRTVSNTHLAHFAQTLDVEVTRSELLAYEIDEPDLEAFLKEIGWNEMQYRRFIVAPLLLAQKTEDVVFHDVAYQSVSLEKMHNVEQDLALGISFDDLAIQYSEDVSGPSGGYLGFYTLDQMPEGLEEVFDADVGVPSGVLETNGSFVIARVHDEFLAGGEREQVSLQIISVKKTGLATALEAYAETQRVIYMVR